MKVRGTMTSGRSMSGGCLCGKVRFSLASQPRVAVNCHCTMCRRHSGAAYLTYLAVDATAFEIEAGEPVPYRSSSDAIRTHCGSCGSPLTFVFDSDRDSVWVTLGSFDDPDPLAPTENWFVKDKVEWVAINAKLKNFDGPPDA